MFRFCARYHALCLHILGGWSSPGPGQIYSARYWGSPIEHKILPEPQHWRRPLKMQSSESEVMSIIRGSISEPSFPWGTVLLQLSERKVSGNTLELKRLCPSHHLITGYDTKGGPPLPCHRRPLGPVQLGHLKVSG
uniref:Uncharacterized protein n=1 Tax=Pipistrellus kuhlii TaxID=59472 RepID=A0A7J7VN75_PIPKU|nr:hypothetical protein mPipKuh1_008405 [Pipistrellus kuhlii]